LRERDATCGSLATEQHRGLRVKVAEEIGPTSGRLGNFAHAFTHLGLISAAVNLDRQLG
jgi:hypothetical protein